MKYAANFVRKAILVGFIGLAAQTAFAQSSLDPAARDTLIDKLSKVYLNLAPGDAAKVAITLRLADLHAERARLNSMKELNEGCTVCNAGREDRLKALSYYKEVMGKVPESMIAKVLTQVGHLYEMTNNESEAIATYERIIKEMKSPEAQVEANLSLGEVFFKHRDYAKAQGYFQAVVNAPQAASRGLAAYKIAWCEFNQGNLDVAIQGLVKILKTPELLARGASAEVAQADKQFQEEVSRDLATFLARRNVSVDDAKLVYELSPDNAKMANTTYLASEAERLGQVQGAIALWRFAQERQKRPELRLEGHVHLAQLEMSQKMLADAIKDFDMALGIWGQVAQCQDASCKELKTRIRNFVVDWNTNEKKAPSEQLLAAYQSYLKVFPTESDMTIWAAKIATDLKQYPLAVQLYQTAAKLASATQGKESSDRMEAGLLGAIEAAELSKEPKLLDSAYDSYLAMSRERKTALEVQYQKAHIVYDKGDYKTAVDALKAVAFSKEKGAAAVRKQAADLSLDALVLLKDDTKLESLASEYAKAFPADAKEFSAISRKSILTQSAAAASAQSPDALKTSWETLSRFDIGSASQEEKATFYKNKLILAEKLQRFGDARQAADSLLSLPNVPAADREYALSRKAWLAELVLDFETALVATEKIPATSEADKRWLKLAMYAELASKDPKPYYGQFLKQSKDDDKNAAIAAQFVRTSKEPLKEIEKNKAILAKRPELLGELYLEVFGSATPGDSAKKALAIPAVASSASGKVIARSLFLDDVAKLKTKVVAHQLDASTQKKMAATLKGRVALLAEIDKLAEKAVSSGDWTSQLVVLDLLAKQSDRFYQEILSLPVPAGLSAEDEQEYLSLLSQQAAPHQVRANDVAKKVTEFWSSDKAVAQLDEALTTETGARRNLLTKEVQALIDVAPDAKKTQLQAMLARPEAKKELPTLASLEQARQGVRENPLDKKRLESLLALERKLGRQTMVAYLEGRLQTLDKNLDGK